MFATPCRGQAKIQENCSAKGHTEMQHKDPAVFDQPVCPALTARPDSETHLAKFLPLEASHDCWSRDQLGLLLWRPCSGIQQDPAGFLLRDTV